MAEVKKETVKPVTAVKTDKAVTKPAADAAAVKAAPVPVVKEEVKAEVKTAVKPEAKAAVKAEPKKETPKKTAAKAAPKKTAANKTAKTEVKKSIHLQFGGKSYESEDFVKIAKDVWRYDLHKKPADMLSLEIYVKPEEGLAYYVFNGDVTGSFAI